MPAGGEHANALTVDRDIACPDQRAIAALAAIDDVHRPVATAGKETIGSCAAFERIDAAAGVDGVRTVAPFERVPTAAAEEEVAAVLAGERVGTSPAENDITALRAREDVVAGTPNDPLGGGGGERARAW